MAEDTPCCDDAANPEPVRRSDPRIFCFEQVEEERAFDLSVTKLIAMLQEPRLSVLKTYTA